MWTAGAIGCVHAGMLVPIAVLQWLLPAPIDWAKVVGTLALGAAFLMLAFYLFRQARRMSRRERGCCLTCGYDLRESAGFCPECGPSISSVARPKKMDI